MCRYLVSILTLVCAVMTLGGTIAPNRAHAQITCGVATGNDGNPNDVRVVSVATGAMTCDEDALATPTEYGNPTTNTRRFAVYLPGDQPVTPTDGPVKIIARDDNGDALTIKEIICPGDTSGTVTYSGVGTTIGEIDFGSNDASCDPLVVWESSAGDVSFTGGTIRKNAGRYRLLAFQGSISTVSGGPFGGSAATTLNGTGELQRNNVTFNDGDTDDLGTQTADTPVTLTYTVANTGGQVLELSHVFPDALNGRNIIDNVQLSIPLVPQDPNDPPRTPQTQLIEIPIGTNYQFTITFTPTHATDFYLPLEYRLNDTPTILYISGSADPDDDPCTKCITNNFMVRRGTQIIGKEPDLTKRLGSRMIRRQPSLKDSPIDGPVLGLGGPVSVTGEGTAHNHNLAFATSLRQVLRSRQLAKQRRVGATGSMMALGARDRLADQSSDAPGDDPDERRGHYFNDDGYAQPQSRFGLWAEGTWARIDDGTTESDFGLLYIGADYRFNPGLVVGMIAQFDQTDETDSTHGFAIEGRGWLAGPYIVARLGQNLIFDARGAWGKSDNEISPDNTYTDDFEGRRWLVRSRLTGDFKFGAIHVAPHVGVVYFEEEQKAYTDSNGVRIGSQTVELGRLTFGPKISTSFKRRDGTTIAPFVALQGIWDFKRTDLVDLNTGLAITGTDELRARAEAGLSVRLPQGLSITGEGFYDGIGANGYNAYGGSLKVGVPF